MEGGDDLSSTEGQARACGTGRGGSEGQRARWRLRPHVGSVIGGLTARGGGTSNWARGVRVDKRRCSAGARGRARG